MAGGGDFAGAVVFVAAAGQGHGFCPFVKAAPEVAVEGVVAYAVFFGEVVAGHGVAGCDLVAVVQVLGHPVLPSGFDVAVFAAVALVYEGGDGVYGGDAHDGAQGHYGLYSEQVAVLAELQLVLPGAGEPERVFGALRGGGGGLDEIGLVGERIGPRGVLGPAVGVEKPVDALWGRKQARGPHGAGLRVFGQRCAALDGVATFGVGGVC